MLKKLMKYDLKSLYRTLIPMYIVMLAISLFNRFGQFAADKLSILQIPSSFITVVYIVILIGVIIATFIVTIVRFYNNLIKDEGYLMHTLPVTKSQLILSKLLTFIIVTLSSILLCVIGLFIGSYNIYFTSDTIKSIFELIKLFNTQFIILMVISTIVGFILQQLIVYLSITLGQTHNGNKIVYSVVYGIVIYNIIQILSSVILIVPMTFNKKYWKYLNNDTPPIHFLNGYLIAAIIISIIFAFICYIITERIMTKKLNLD